MMNKIKTSRVQLLRLLLLLPAIAILLLAFRQNKSNPQVNLAQIPVITGTQQNEVADLPDTTKKKNNKGYDITIVDNKGNCEIIIKDGKNNFVKWLPLTEWNRKQSYYENLYGEIPPPPKVLPPTPPTPPAPPVAINGVVEEVMEAGVPTSPQPPTASNSIVEEVPVPPAPGKPVEMPANVKRVQIKNNKAEVELKNGKVENYDLNKPDEKAAFEKKYGKMPEAPVPPAAPIEVAPAVNNKGYSMVIQNAQKDYLVIIYNEKNREVRKVMLAEWNKDKTYFQKTYGDLPMVPAPVARPQSPFFEFASLKKDGC